MKKLAPLLAGKIVIDSGNNVKSHEDGLPQYGDGPSMGETVQRLAPEARVETVGLRPGEKLHEEMISVHEARRTVDRGDHYVICPEIRWAGQRRLEGEPLADGFRYSSDLNDDWLDTERLAALLET